MPDRDFLRDRGLADGQAPAQTPPFGVAPNGSIVMAGDGAPVAYDGVPFDYEARRQALWFALDLVRAQVVKMEDCLPEARRFHVFLTATEEKAPKTQERTFTDE
jgi:hypothetical protein